MSSARRDKRRLPLSLPWLSRHACNKGLRLRASFALAPILDTVFRLRICLLVQMTLSFWTGAPLVQGLIGILVNVAGAWDRGIKLRYAFTMGMRAARLNSAVSVAWWAAERAKSVELKYARFFHLVSWGTTLRHIKSIPWTFSQANTRVVAFHMCWNDVFLFQRVAEPNTVSVCSTCDIKKPKPYLWIWLSAFWFHSEAVMQAPYWIDSRCTLTRWLTIYLPSDNS